MKALSIKQPWANLIASGRKTIETRKWKTNYRGDLLIVASKTGTEPPFGCAVAIATLVDCCDMTKDDVVAACTQVYPRACSWVLENIRPIEPFPVKGQLGLYEVDIEQAASTA